jgi:hypothetical protein
VSKESREIKVTDKRMFTADGKLRDEYSFLEDTAAGSAADGGAAQAAASGGAEAAAAASPAPERETGRRESPRREPEHREPGRREPSRREPERARGAGGRAEPFRGEPADDAADFGQRLEIPGAPPGLGPTFYDLVAILAEPVSIYLGDVELPDGQTAENLEMARLHIDLLDVLRQKTAGNLTAQESAFLEDLLYRLRVRYVQKRG